MADVWPSYDRPGEAGHWCPTDVAAAGSLTGSPSGTTATADGCTTAGSTAEL